MKLIATLLLALGIALPASAQSGTKIVFDADANGQTGAMQTGPAAASVTFTFCGTGFSGTVLVDAGATQAGLAQVSTQTMTGNSDCTTTYAKSPATKWYRVRWTRSAGTLNVWMNLGAPSYGSGSYSDLAPPTGCVATSVPIFFGSPVTLGCDVWFTYNGTTKTLSTPTISARNVTVTALATPTITSPLVVNGTPGVTTYGYKRVSLLADGTSTAASAEVTIATGNATLDATNNITISWPAVTGSVLEKIYRTTGGAAPPKLIYTGTALTTTDIGAAGTAETPATIPTTGIVTAGQFVGKLDGSGLRPAYAFDGFPGFGMTKLGNAILFTNGTGTSASYIAALGYATQAVSVAANGAYAFTQTSNNPVTTLDTILTRGGAAATLQLGAAASATPVSQTFQAQGGSGTDIPGANLTIQSGAGTGAGAVSTLEFKTPTVGSTGTAAQTQGTRVSISSAATTLSTPLTVSATTTLRDVAPSANDLRNLGTAGAQWAQLAVARIILGSRSKVLTDASATAFATIPLATGAATAGEIIYRVVATDGGTARQVLSGRARYSGARDGATYDADVSEVGTQTTSVTTGTLTGAITVAGASDLLTFSANFDTNLGTPVLTIHYRFDSTDTLAITPL